MKKKPKGIFGTVSTRDLAQTEARIIAALQRAFDADDKAATRATLKRLMASAYRLETLSKRTSTYAGGSGATRTTNES